MSTLDVKPELRSTIWEEVLSELEESRACYAQGEGEDFDKAIDEIRAKYGL